VVKISGYDKKVREIAIKMIKELKWTQKEVAEFIGVSPTTVARWCRLAGIEKKISNKTVNDEVIINFIREKKVTTSNEIIEKFGNVRPRLLRLVDKGIIKRSYVTLPKRRWLRRKLFNYCRRYYYFIDFEDFKTFLSQLPYRPKIVTKEVVIWESHDEHPWLKTTPKPEKPQIL